MAKTAIQGFQQGLIGRADLRAPVVAFAEPWLQSAASAPSPTRREVVKTHSRDESALCSRVIAELAPGAACAAAATLLGRGLVATRALAPGDAVLSGKMREEVRSSRKLKRGWLTSAPMCGRRVVVDGDAVLASTLEVPGCPSTWVP